MGTLLLLFITFAISNAAPSMETEYAFDSYSINHALEEKYRSRYFQNKSRAKPKNMKYEQVCIMTRDNVCLSTNVYTPTLHHKPYDVLYAKTPYGKVTLDPDCAVAEPNGWVCLAQDIRGRHASNGTFSFWRESGNDTMDTLKWILAQPWSSGNVAAIGLSANALAQYADLTGVTVFPLNTSEWTEYNNLFQHIRTTQLFLGNAMGWHTVFQGGAYRTGLISGWMNVFGEPNVIDTVLENEVFNPWWDPLCGPLHRYNESLAQWSYVNQSMVHFAGFYDIFSTGQILTAMAVNKTSQINAQNKQILIVDPGGHCVTGDILWEHDLYGFELVEYWGIPAVDDAFRHGSANNMSNYDIHKFFPFNVLFYQLGPGLEENGNYWVEAESFPPFEDNKWYLQSGGFLSPSQQTSEDEISYDYNPKKPVETWGGNNLFVQPCGPWSQHRVERGREDILHWTSDVLNADIALVGLLRLNLFVESDAVDTDFTAKLIDVHPNDEPFLVQDGIFRMRWRETATWTFEDYQTEPSPPMEKGRVYNITIDLGFMSFIFNKGHKISVSVSSSNYRRFSVNYNSGNMVIDGDKNWKIAKNTVHFGGKYPSAFILPVVDLEWLEERKVKQEKIDHVHETVMKHYAQK